MAFYKCPRCDSWVASHMSECPSCKLSIDDVIISSSTTVGEEINVEKDGQKNTCNLCNRESISYHVNSDIGNLCKACLKKELMKIKISTTSNLEGYRIIDYIDIESVEIVIGTGFFSELTSDISDFFGARSTAFEEKMQKAKRLAFDKLKLVALERKGNAVIGIDIDYTEFNSNKIGVIVNGTIVKIEKN